MKTDPADPMYHFRNAKPWVQVTVWLFRQLPAILAALGWVVGVCMGMIPDTAGKLASALADYAVAIHQTNQGNNLNSVTTVTPGSNGLGGQARAIMPPADK